MNAIAVNGLGWLATATFVASYFFVRPRSLRAMQMLGALLWILYGTLIAAPPVIVANVLVICAAAWSLLRAAPPSTPESGRSQSGPAAAVLVDD